jgi:hypothetical protein
VGGVLQGLTSGVAVAALVISFWQGSRARLLTKQANAGPVMASVYGQFRDKSFRRAVNRLRAMPMESATGGFTGLPDDFQDDAYTVCYYFEYIGLLVYFRHLDRDLVLGSMSTQLVEVWRIMQPWIAGERAVRESVKDPYRGSRFLPHYEHLVALITKERSGYSDHIIQGKIWSFEPGHELYPRIAAEADDSRSQPRASA